MTRHVIYVLTDPGIPAFGRKGASSHVQSVLRELTARVVPAGGTVTLVATRLGGDVPDGLEAVRTVEFGRPKAKDPAEAEVALQQLDACAADTVLGTIEQIRAAHAGQGEPEVLVYQRYSLWSALVMERAREAGAATVMEVNAPLIEEQATHRVLVDESSATALTVRAFRAAHLVYGVSTAVATWAAQVAGLDPALVPAVPNGVDVDRFTRAAEVTATPTAGADAADTEHTAPTAPTVPTVAFVGTFRPWHATDKLVEAAARLAAHGTPVRLLLVGEGPMLQDTVERARTAGVAVESVGAVDPAQVPGLLARADIAAAPYPAGEVYFSPLKVAEYLAAGLATVASAVADLPRLFSAQEVALVTPGDTEEFTEALALLVTDLDARRSLAAAGRAAAVRRFGWDAVVDRVLAALDARTLTPTSSRDAVEATA